MASLGPKDIYLILYNSACCVGWAVVLAGGIKTLAQGDGSISESLSNVYAPVADMLIYSQSAALMEILHAALGLVRSPVLVTAMQVSSRIFALVAIAFAPTAQGECPIASES
jgi:very-long-chain (3R)-3-hydroxyacyl-CoA dehydratase